MTNKPSKRANREGIFAREYLDKGSEKVDATFRAEALKTRDLPAWVLRFGKEMFLREENSNGRLACHLTKF